LQSLDQRERRYVAGQWETLHLPIDNLVDYVKNQDANGWVLAIKGPSNEHLDPQEHLHRTVAILLEILNSPAIDKAQELPISKNDDITPRILDPYETWSTQKHSRYRPAQHSLFERQAVTPHVLSYILPVRSVMEKQIDACSVICTRHAI